MSRAAALTPITQPVRRFRQSPSFDAARRGHDVIRWGESGDGVLRVQNLLLRAGHSVAEDSFFGPNTDAKLRSFQSRHNLRPDGIVGPRTAAALLRYANQPVRTGRNDDAPVANPRSYSLGPDFPALYSGTATLEKMHKGMGVQTVQQLLNGANIPCPVTGWFDDTTDAAVRAFQAREGLEADGVVGEDTAQRLIDRQRTPVNREVLGIATPSTTSATAGLQQPSSTGVSTSGVRATGNAGASGPQLEIFPVGGGQFNIGWDRSWNDFNLSTARQSSDYYTRSTSGHRSGHLGNDIFGPRGAPILSPVSGTVVRVRRTESAVGGLTVTVKRGNHYFYMAHLDSVASNLRVGQRITAGTQVGTLGDTGSARGTGPHLHFSIYQRTYRNGIDPFPYLQRVIPSANGR